MSLGSNIAAILGIPLIAVTMLASATSAQTATPGRPGLVLADLTEPWSNTRSHAVLLSSEARRAVPVEIAR